MTRPGLNRPGLNRPGPKRAALMGLALLVGMLLLALVAPIARAKDVPLGPSPHGDPGACAACHEKGNSLTEPGPPKPIIATCRGCHPTADMHPVGMSPRDVTVHAGWPLEDGKVTCATCHAEPAHGGEYAALPAPCHRGGPYKPIAQLCAQCHDISAFVRKNPHHPVTPRSSQDPTCAACHTVPPVTDALPDDAKLRLKPTEVCSTCHKSDIHLGSVAHLEKQLTPAMRATLAGRLPLTDEDKIACWTCHEVHGDNSGGERRLRPIASALRSVALDKDWPELKDMTLSWPAAGAAADADGGDTQAAPPLLALPDSNGALCSACHGDGPS